MQTVQSMRIHVGTHEPGCKAHDGLSSFCHVGLGFVHLTHCKGLHFYCIALCAHLQFFLLPQIHNWESKCLH